MISVALKGKAFLIGVSLLSSTAVMAEGYQVNTISARQLGMGHTGFALKLGAESQFFNPAGMAFLDKQIDLSASVTAISPRQKLPSVTKATKQTMMSPPLSVCSEQWIFSTT